MNSQGELYSKPFFKVTEVTRQVQKPPINVRANEMFFVFFFLQQDQFQSKVQCLHTNTTLKKYIVLLVVKIAIF